MHPIPAKSLRTVGYHLRVLFGKTAFKVPRKVEDFKVPNLLGRLLEVANKREVLLTDVGVKTLADLVKTISDADVFEGMADYADVYSAGRRAYAEFLSQGMQPDDAAEFVDVVRRHVEAGIDTRHFIAPVFGIELGDVDEVVLGDFRIVPASANLFTKLGIEHDGAHLESAIQAMGNFPWLIGAARGTGRVSFQNFQNSARLVTGLLCVFHAIVNGHSTGW